MKWKRSSSSSTSSSTYVREAYHAGSWYDSDPSILDDALSSFLQQVNENENENENDSSASPPPSAQQQRPPRGIIAPHAGYSYSGSTAAYAYAALGEALALSLQESITTVVVLHPSHHVHLDGCAISNATEIETPLGNVMVDSDLRTELLQVQVQKQQPKLFQLMTKSVDEREHSGEMQYPYIAKLVMDHNNNNNKNRSNSKPKQIRILPIMVGAISAEKERQYGNILAPYLARDHIFTVVSSDFCHWGKRFGYTPTSPPDHIQKPHTVKEIHQYIEWMDRLGMDQIANQEPGAFAKYIRLYKNTICGRHPIAVYLWALKTNQENDSNGNNGGENVHVTFVKYDQSSRVVKSHESSVSYASAVVRRI